jgi:hypothetical protein
MEDLRRIRFATRHFKDLQGLRLIPIGLAMGLNVWLQRPGRWDIGIAGGLLLLAFLVAWALGPYYRRRLGHVTARPSSDAQKLAAVGMVVLFYFLQWLEVERGLPVSIFGMFWACWAAALFLTHPRLRWYWGVAAGALAVSSILPALGISTTQELWGQHSRIGHTLFGVAVTVCGIMDHRLLLALFPAQPAESPEELAYEHSV